MNSPVDSQFVNVKMLDFIKLNPSPILNLHAQDNRLYVSRQHYSEIYQIASQNNQPLTLQQIAQFQPSLYFIAVGPVLALFKPYQLKVLINGKWQYHSFTTQLISVRVIQDTVYSFHEKEVIAWHLVQDQFTFKYLTEAQAPYHLDSQGSIVGLGKKVKQVNKGSKLTRCEAIDQQWVFVGDDKGALHVYDWKFLSHVKSFHEHEAPILAIKVSPKEKTVYFTGSDSKLCVIKLVAEEWHLGEKNRGQSHDIMSLELLSNCLISGGITTDFCFYPLRNGQFQGSFFHRVSYCGSSRTSSQGKYLLVNHRNSFEIWEIGSNLYRTTLVVRYQMPNDKFIVDGKIFKQEIEDSTYLVLIMTDEDTVGWKFSAERGLTKYITIQNQYEMVELLPKHAFLGLRSDGLIEKVSCLTGKIEEITFSQVQLPTDLLYLGNGLALVGSKIIKSVNLINIRKKQTVKRFTLRETYTYIDHLDQQDLLVQYFNNPILFKFNLDQEKETEVVKLPVNLIRFGGWLSSVTKAGEKQLKSKIKKYWYGISEGKIVIIPNIQKEGSKKVRIKQTDRIAQVIRPATRSLGCNLAVIPYQFTRMVNQLPVKPVFTKKIV